MLQSSGFSSVSAHVMVLLLYLLLTAVCVSVPKAQDVKFIMVHMLKLDLCSFLGPPCPGCLAFMACVLQLQTKVEGMFFTASGPAFLRFCHSYGAR